MIKLLAREPRACEDQILSDKAGHMYAKDGEKAAAYLRLLSQVCKRELKPLACTPTGARAHRCRAARQAQTATVRRLRQKEVVRALLREHVSGAPYVPTAWKLAKLHPLLKSGNDPSLLESYRPISLLECLGKLMERIVATRLEDVVERSQLLPHSQAGFRRWRSTEDPLLDLISDLQDTRARKNNKDLLVILLDFEKAFDRVDPWILLGNYARNWNTSIPPPLV